MVRLDFAIREWRRAVKVGNASLRTAQRLVKSGGFEVDGRLEREPHRQVVPGAEVITCKTSGAQVPSGDHAFFLLNKPKGVLCTTKSFGPRGATVYDLVPESVRRRYPSLRAAGRLDRDTSGVLLFGTDGGLLSLLLHPTTGCQKRYKVLLDPLSDLGLEHACGQASISEAFQAGLQLDDGTCCAPAKIDIVNETVVYVTIREGFYHQVKRMLAQVGGKVVELHRESFGDLQPSDLQLGGFRSLTSSEMSSLAQMISKSPNNRVIPKNRYGHSSLPWKRGLMGRHGGRDILRDCAPPLATTRRAISNFLLSSQDFTAAHWTAET